MSVIVLIMAVLAAFKVLPSLFERAETFVEAFKRAHEEIEAEAQIYGYKAYSINFYSPTNNR